MHHARWLCALALTACFTDDPPLVAASDDDDEGDDASSSSSGIPDPPTVTSAPSSASSTSAPEDDDGSSSSDASSSSSSGSESSESSSSDDMSSSSTGPEPYEGPYGDCWDGPVQHEDGRYLCPPSPCVVAPPDHSACAPECGAGCEPGPDGVGTTCLDTIADGTVPAVCVIVCAGDGSPCPDTMECKQTDFEAAGEFLWMCMWS